MAIYNGIDDAARALTRAKFEAAVQQGDITPLIIPYSLTGAFIAPILWLTIPQARYPWVYHTRWLLVTFVIWFNIKVALTTSSGNMAVSYATGLMASWGIVYNLNLVLWTRPQRDAMRVVLRREGGGRDDSQSLARGGESLGKDPNGSQSHGNGSVEGVKRRFRGKENGSSAAAAADQSVQETRHHEDNHELEYVWEGFPVHGTFGQRLNWVFDLATSFRGCGWNWCISALPQPKDPKGINRSLVDFSAMPKTSKTGFSHTLTLREFYFVKLRTLVFNYLLIDLLAMKMAQDPYFVFGPDSPHFAAHPVPSHLSSLHPILLLWLRQLMSLAGFIAAIIFMMTLNAVAQYHFTPYLIDPSHGALFQYPSIFGSYTNITSRGLNGWWGGWWHQTFRAQFLAPATFLRRKGYTSNGSLAGVIVALVVSFGQSGLMHMVGSLTAVPETKLWRSPLFFIMQVPGIILQAALAKMVRHAWPTIPRRVAQIGNLVTTIFWVQWTSRWFCDDIASTGLWLCDPLPFSPLRMMGFGVPGDRWWRWDRYDIPGWYTGQHWLESGVAL